MTAEPLHVVVSHLVLDPIGADALEDAFANRLGEVEDAGEVGVERYTLVAR